MWPTENTHILLTIGLVPLVIVLFQAARNDFMELLSLRFAGIFFMWLGYQFSPWCGYLSGKEWDTFLLVDKYIDQGILFSALSMFAYLVGFNMVFKKKSKNHFSIHNRPRLIFPKISGKLLIVLIMVSFLMFLTSVGGFEEMWRSIHPRGEGQFLQRDFSGKILRINTILLTVIQTVLACAATLYIVQSKRDVFRQLAGWLGILVSSVSSIWFFSRGAGFSFIIFSFLSLKLKGRKSLFIAIISFSIAIFLGNVGLSERGSYYPGLGNFLDSALKANNLSTDNSMFISPTTIRNPLDAMGPWTRKAEASDFEKASFIKMGPRFFWNLNPFPSELVPLAPLGRDLAEIMGTYGFTGLTTPALAEVYYAFGIWGFLFMLPLGAAYAWFERLTYLKPGVISSICFTICFISFPVGLHSSMRPMTRPLVYSFVIAIIGKRLIRFNKRRKRRSFFYLPSYDINKANKSFRPNGGFSFVKSDVNDKLKDKF
jgi:hypothetical protein